MSQTASAADLALLDRAYEQTAKSFDEGGLPIGVVLVRDGEVLAKGSNRRVQSVGPIAPGAMGRGRRRTLIGRPRTLASAPARPSLCEVRLRAV